MFSVRARVLAWAARRYLSRTPTTGVDLSDIAYLPNSVLWPLRRNGLDPIDQLARVRAQEPVSRLPLPFGVKAWLVTGYDEVRQVLARADSFSNDFGNLAGSAGVDGQHDPGGLGFADPPAHTRLRRLLTPEFTVRRLQRLQPRIDAIIAELLDTIDKIDGPVDLWPTFALPIPSLTICELLGVPYHERRHFQRLSMARFDLAGGGGSSLSAMTESVSYLLDLVARQRVSPGDGLLGALIREHGDAIDDRELAGLADGVLTGGLETTASMLALGILVILQNPESAPLLTAGDGDSINQYVEELLRYLTVVQVAFPRFATRDIEIAAVTIAAGDGVACSLSAANRDTARGSHMNDFDPTRPSVGHLAFGHGIHRCIGAELARMELRAAFPALLSRFPDLHLAVEPDQLTFRNASIVYGLDTLPVIIR
jgi:cytochrome P450